MDILLGLLTLGLLGALVWKILIADNNNGRNEEYEILKKEKEILFEENIKLKADQEYLKSESIKFQQNLKTVESDRDELSGKNKQTFVQLRDLQNDYKNIQLENAELKKQISQFEAKKEQVEAEYFHKIEKLEHAREKFEKEQERVIRADHERQEKIREEQNRIWNDHENLVLSRLRESCQRPDIGFLFYENTSLPSAFDGSLKPDFLIEFLGQYIIFDAKKSKDPKKYIDSQIKSSVKKYKEHKYIYSTVFFVMPVEEVASLKQLSFFEDGFSFFVIASDAIEPILAALKKISDYDKIQDFDPQDRENLVNLIANYDRHISFQNAANILLAQHSTDLMRSKDTLAQDLQDEIEMRKGSMRDLKLKDSEVKKIAQDLDVQKKEVQKLISPKVAISSKDIENAEQLF